jgi:predicted signal transduction protein with EAL and GGDEF domain
MPFAQFFTLLAFIIINFLILFIVRTRTSTIISLIITNLVAILFFSISITNYNSLKEIVLSLIIYSMVVLFLISNYNPLPLNKDETLRFKLPKIKIFLMPIVAIAFFGFFLTLFLIANDLSRIAENIHDKEISAENKIAAEPDDKSLNEAPKIAQNSIQNKPSFQSNSGLNDIKKARLKDKLFGNFLLKRSSDMILLIVAVATSLLLLTSRKPSEKS